MASLEDDARMGGGHPSPRREPPTIDVEAVETPVEGAATSRQTESDPPKSTNTAEQDPRPGVPASRSRWAVIGSVAAVIIAASAAASWVYYAPGSGRTADELRARVAGLEAQHRDDADRLAASLATATATRAKVDDVTARLAKLEAATAATPIATATDAAMANRLAALEAAVKPIAARLDDIDRQIRENAAPAGTPREHGETPKGSTDETAQPAERAAIEGLEARITALESLEATLKTAQDRTEKSAALVAAAAATAAEKPIRAAILAAALRTAVERDYSFTIELAGARAVGLDAQALAALQPFATGGVPSANALFRDLTALLPDLIRLSLPAGQDDKKGGNYLERLQAGAERLVRIRPVADVPGDDASTVISRIEFKIARQDVTGVVADLEKLPAPARELAQPWRKNALAREAAIAAARQLATAAFAQLGEARDLTPR